MNIKRDTGKTVEGFSSTRLSSSEAIICSLNIAGSVSGGGSATATAAALTPAPEAPLDWKATLEKVQQRYPIREPLPIGLRILECTVALFALIIAMPILLFLGILICWDSPGGALFRHDRIGSGGNLFRFTKMRTLYVDAKRRFAHLYAYQYTPRQIEVLCFKVPNDPRVTRVGKWLRQSTLDELPNFWHVLTGDMALVGPRPEIPEMLPYYTDEELVKFSVRPGITGYAQVSGRGRLRFRETAQLDLKYVQERTFWIDVKIMCKTLYLIVRRDGAF